jgi:benzoyl-CoA reductase subunit D
MSDREHDPTPGDELLSAGIDVGSSAVKVAIIADDGRAPRQVAGAAERIRRRDQRVVTETLFDQVVAEAGLTREALDYVATTGEGELVEFRTGHFYSMTAHARGGLFLRPEARAVIDIGALHTRAILMDERSKVLGYAMTSQCASGSGQFLENIGRYLGVTIDEIGPLSKQSQAPEPCSSICAVLAETDVINMVSRNVAIPDILKGIHQSMAGRYVKLLNSVGAKGQVLVTGGLARDDGLMATLREQAEGQGLPLEIACHADSILAGALGAALWGAFRVRKLRQRGLSLAPGA